MNFYIYEKQQVEKRQHCSKRKLVSNKHIIKVHLLQEALNCISTKADMPPTHLPPFARTVCQLVDKYVCKIFGLRACRVAARFSAQPENPWQFSLWPIACGDRKGVVLYLGYIRMRCSKCEGSNVKTLPL